MVQESRHKGSGLLLRGQRVSERRDVLQYWQVRQVLLHSVSMKGASPQPLKFQRARRSQSAQKIGAGGRYVDVRKRYVRVSG